MKADCKIFKGIEYVQVSELPQSQRELLSHTINPDLFIKLLVEGKIVSGCLQYKDYNQWYQENYHPLMNAPCATPILPGMEIKPNLA